MNVLGHGIDIVEIARIGHLIESHGDRFLDRCYTPVERHYADSGRAMRTQRYAARFAAKEAIVKALGTGVTGGITWLDMQIAARASGQPEIHLTGRCAEIAMEMGITHWQLSLSHTAHMAIASVIACGGSE